MPLPPPELIETDKRRAPHGAGILLAFCASALFWAPILLVIWRS